MIITRISTSTPYRLREEFTAEAPPGVTRDKIFKVTGVTGGGLKPASVALVEIKASGKLPIGIIISEKSFLDYFEEAYQSPKKCESIWN